jgi:hypothetical protein
VGWYFTEPYEGVNIVPVVADNHVGLYISGRF